MDFKRGDLVEVYFTGKVINTIPDDGVRVSVAGMKPAWWAVVPVTSVASLEIMEEGE